MCGRPTRTAQLLLTHHVDRKWLQLTLRAAGSAPKTAPEATRPAVRSSSRDPRQIARDAGGNADRAGARRSGKGHKTGANQVPAAARCAPESAPQATWPKARPRGPHPETSVKSHVMPAATPIIQRSPPKAQNKGESSARNGQRHNMYRAAAASGGSCRGLAPQRARAKEVPGCLLRQVLHGDGARPTPGGAPPAIDGRLPPPRRST